MFVLFLHLEMFTLGNTVLLTRMLKAYTMSCSGEKKFLVLKQKIYTNMMCHFVNISKYCFHTLMCKGQTLQLNYIPVLKY